MLLQLFLQSSLIAALVAPQLLSVFMKSADMAVPAKWGAECLATVVTCVGLLTLFETPISPLLLLSKSVAHTLLIVLTKAFSIIWINLEGLWTSAAFDAPNKVGVFLQDVLHDTLDKLELLKAVVTAELAVAMTDVEMVRVILVELKLLITHLTFKGQCPVVILHVCGIGLGLGEHLVAQLAGEVVGGVKVEVLVLFFVLATFLSP